MSRKARTSAYTMVMRVRLICLDCKGVLGFKKMPGVVIFSTVICILFCTTNFREHYLVVFAM